MTSSSSTTFQHLDGKAVAATTRDTLQQALQTLRQQGQRLPKLVVIRVGEDPASTVYTARKARVAQEIGMVSELQIHPKTLPEADLLAHIEALNQDPAVDAILVQLPLPGHMAVERVLSAVDPAKDVDGFHPENLGRLMAGDLPPALPCTPSGIITLLKAYDIPIAGQHAVVIGRSTIVGKPVSLLLLAENATVSMCHSRTRDLAAVTQQADILISAVGRPGLVTALMVKPGAVVVDVGINRLKSGKLTGDVDFEAVAPKTSFITPVPGGVGPMTIAMLMANTLALYHQAKTTPNPNKAT